MQRAKRKTKLKDQNQNLKIFLNFALGSDFWFLHFALIYYLLRVTYYGLLIFNFDPPAGGLRFNIWDYLPFLNFDLGFDFWYLIFELFFRFLFVLIRVF